MDSFFEQLGTKPLWYFVLWRAGTRFFDPGFIVRAKPGMDQMPRYHFVVCEPDYTHDDPDGMHLPNQDAAKDQGNRIVSELKDDGVSHAALLIKDERGHASTALTSAPWRRIK